MNFDLLRLASELLHPVIVEELGHFPGAGDGC
jgi:hypothetical protein